MQANQSITDEAAATTRLVERQDGTKVPYSEDKLKAALESKLEGLNREYVKLDIILAKVGSGLYNGKPQAHQQRAQSPLYVSSSLVSLCFLCLRRQRQSTTTYFDSILSAICPTKIWS